MRILEYVGLDPTRAGPQYRKECAAIARDDFREAEVNKLANSSHGRCYRGKLGSANRLLLTIVRHGETVDCGASMPASNLVLQMDP